MYIKHSPVNRVGCHPLQKSSSQRGQSPFSLKTLQLPDIILHQPPQIAEAILGDSQFPMPLWGIPFNSNLRSMG